MCVCVGGVSVCEWGCVNAVRGMILGYCTLRHQYYKFG